MYMYQFKYIGAKVQSTVESTNQAVGISGGSFGTKHRGLALSIRKVSVPR